MNEEMAPFKTSVEIDDGNTVLRQALWERPKNFPENQTSEFLEYI